MHILCVLHNISVGICKILWSDQDQIMKAPFAFIIYPFFALETFKLLSSCCSEIFKFLLTRHSYSIILGNIIIYSSHTTAPAFSLTILSLLLLCLLLFLVSGEPQFYSLLVWGKLSWSSHVRTHGICLSVPCLFYLMYGGGLLKNHGKGGLWKCEKVSWNLKASIFLPTTWEKQPRMACVFVACHLDWRPGWSIWFLASAWPRPTLAVRLSGGVTQ